MKLYLGVDLHKKSCWVTVMNVDGRIVDSQRIGTERGTLLNYFGKVEKPAALAVEATFNRYDRCRVCAEYSVARTSAQRRHATPNQCKTVGLHYIARSDPPH